MLVVAPVPSGSPHEPNAAEYVTRTRIRVGPTVAPPGTLTSPLNMFPVRVRTNASPDGTLPNVKSWFQSIQTILWSALNGLGLFT